MFGNDLLPSKFCITAELLRAKYTTPDSETHDEFSHLIQCNVRHAAVTLLPNERFCAPLPPDAKDERRVRLEKPPLRPAGAPSSASAGAAGKRPPLPAQTDDSCVTLASVANFDLLYKQDVPGVHFCILCVHIGRTFARSHMRTRMHALCLCVSRQCSALKCSYSTYTRTPSPDSPFLPSPGVA